MMEFNREGMYALALRTLGSNDHITPENILLAYARLLSIDGKKLDVLAKNIKSDDITAAYLWFACDYDIDKVRSYLPRIIMWLPKDYDGEAFKRALDDVDKSNSLEVLDKAVERCIVPFKSLFSLGSKEDNIKEYLEMIKSKEWIDDDFDGVKREQKSAQGWEIFGPSIDSEKLGSAKDLDSIEQLSEKYSGLMLRLLEKVKGQDRAVLKFVQGYNQGELFRNNEKRNRPRSYYFFFGPPGVGKTFLAEEAAKTLGIPCKVFNMSEYASRYDCDRLIGFDPGYKNARDGELTSFVAAHKRCFLVFDEIEKAHITIIRLFLQILGTGNLLSAYTKKTVSFADTVIVFTSNVGRELYEDGNIVLSEIPEKVLIDAVKSETMPNQDVPVLPPEICSRIASGNVVVFDHLLVKHLVEIIDTKYQSFVDLMQKEYGIDVSYAKELPLLFLLNRGASIDARVAANKGEDFLKDEFFEFTRQYVKEQAEAEIKRLDFVINWDNIDKELEILFKPNKKQSVLVLADPNYNIQDYIDKSKCVVYQVNTLEEAEKALGNELTAVLIDPFCGALDSNNDILSISDYNTLGIKFFHELKQKKINIPVYILETSNEFVDVDRKTFIMEGARGYIPFIKEKLAGGRESSFGRMFMQTMTDLYTEAAIKDFTQRGWIITYNTRQNIIDGKGTYSIEFYDLKKRMAVDMDGRGAVLSEAERPNVKFSDIIGAEEAKKELQYFVEYLKHPRSFVAKRSSKRLPKGVLLYGPPGTGKTMLAKAMAGESDIMFFQATAASFKDKYTGESEANIRKLFTKARKYAPAIVFIDEIDAIGKQRTGLETTATIESMLNTLLTEMDGFSSNPVEKPVFVLAATNFGVGRDNDNMKSLDSALIRRFDNIIYVDLPNEEERKKYLKLMLSQKPEAQVSEATIQNIAERTPRVSLAVLQNVVGLAERNSERLGRALTDDDLLQALEDYTHGQKREQSYSYYREVACHEVGHALLSYLSGDKPSYISIEARANFGGYMQQHANQENKPNYTKDELLGIIRTCMGGRAAERVFFGTEIGLNTGASSDLKKATDWAFKIVCGLGMEFNNLVVLDRKEVMQSPVAADYLQKVNNILLDQMKEAEAIILQKKIVVERIVAELLKKNYLTGEEFDNLMKRYNN